MHPLITKELERHLRGQARGLGRIDQHRIALAPVDLGTHFEAGGLGLDQFADALTQQHTHLRVEGAHAQLELGLSRNHVVGLTGLKCTNGDHGRLQRVDIARDHGLQGHHDGRGRDHRIGGGLRHGAVATDAVQGDAGVVAGGHGRALAKIKMTSLQARHVVQGKHRIAGKALEQAVGHHAQRAAAAFFGRLKNQVQRAIEMRVFGDQLRGSEQDGGVAVMTAGVHQARLAAGPRPS